ncbi:glutaminase [Colwellia psychrerythraea]|uniref:Glutaminase n=1 Tax=Colwellia psychrerythraea TaxID=28229 RepID=A0A099KZP2_COLPS|nr:glutaminase [Colwellia psychrerythraea]KGJ95083.1 Glutaminase [Colwellia psychrerythraea]
MNLLAVLKEIHQEVTPLLGQGNVAKYIPALAKTDPMQFGMAITLNDGQFYGVGSYEKTFSIQSIAKVFSYTLALRAYQNDLYKRVWREPSGTAFNSLIQLEKEAGIPRNPFINAGAIAVCDSLVTHYSPDKTALNEVITFIHECCGERTITFDQAVSESEMEHGFRNIALANLMKSFGNFENDVHSVIETYFQVCSIAMSAKQLSRSMLYLANNGTDPISRKNFISSPQAKRINSLMLTCGHYDASGDFAFRVGLPGKSGVGGGIVAVVPGKMSIAVYSPALNKYGNSLVGTKALELFTTKTGLSIF